jgi:MarR family transcriptional regulator, organic hydroperoxide resistance regulator
MSPFKYKTPETSPGFILWQVHMLWQKKINRLLKPFQITHTQFVILATLFWMSQRQEPNKQARIAQLSKIDPVVISTVLKTLEKKGCVTRHGTQDLRIKEVLLTVKGTDIIRQTIQVVESFDSNFFGEVSLTELATKITEKR